MSEDPAPYGNELVDGRWSVRWSVQLDENPVALVITERDQLGQPQSVLTLPLTAKQAELLQQALGTALEQLKWKQPIDWGPATVLRFDGDGGLVPR
jgi:hypothetical protein